MTFETKCWEGDWRQILTTSYLETLIARNCYEFTVRALFINNVDDAQAVVRSAEELRQRGILTEYHLVADHADCALQFFGLTRSDLRRGYVYSIAELVAIYLARTDYLAHFSSDSVLAEPVDWIWPCLRLFQDDPSVQVCNCAWTPDRTLIAAESTAERRDFFLGYGFSDQNYLRGGRELMDPFCSGNP